MTIVFPRHLACEEDRGEEAKLLVEHGARFDLLNNEEVTAIDMATKGLAVILQRLSDNRIIQNNWKIEIPPFLFVFLNFVFLSFHLILCAQLLEVKLFGSVEHDLQSLSITFCRKMGSKKLSILYKNNKNLTYYLYPRFTWYIKATAWTLSRFNSVVDITISAALRFNRLAWLDFETGQLSYFWSGCFSTFLPRRLVMPSWSTTVWVVKKPPVEYLDSM